MEGIREVRERAIDEAKTGGDSLRAVALALVYVGDAIRDHYDEETSDALRAIAVEVGGLSRAVADAGVV